MFFKKQSKMNNPSSKTTYSSSCIKHLVLDHLSMNNALHLDAPHLKKCGTLRKIPQTWKYTSDMQKYGTLEKIQQI